MYDIYCTKRKMTCYFELTFNKYQNTCGSIIKRVKLRNKWTFLFLLAFKLIFWALSTLICFAFYLNMLIIWIYCYSVVNFMLLLWIIYVISVLFLLCFHARLLINALWSLAGKGLTSWLSFVMSNCEVVTFPLVSWVRCGAWLYWFLIFALFLTFMS